MSRAVNIDSERFGRINVQIPRVIIKRLTWLCEQREAEEGERCTQARIIKEILLRHTPKHPDELVEEPAYGVKKPVSRGTEARRRAVL